MKILHIINGLNDGGAEAILYQVTTGTPAIQHIVVSLLPDGKYAKLLATNGIKVYTLNINGLISLLRAPIKLRKIILESNPVIVQTWMYHSDVFGGILSRIFGVKKIIWSIHNSTLKFKQVKMSTILISRIAAILSYIVPDRIVYCAQSARNEQEKIGYCKSRANVVTNGYDLSRYNPHGPKLNIPSLLNCDFKIGYVGRDHPHKDLQTLFRGFKKFCDADHSATLFMCGFDFVNTNLKLIEMIHMHGLQDHVVLLGPQLEIENFYRAIDVLVLSSASEAFPNVLNEAMACGVPCISTNVGDCRDIIGSTGWIIQPKDCDAMCKSLDLALLEKIDNGVDWELRRQFCSKRITDHNSKSIMLSKYLDIWHGLGTAAQIKKSVQ